MFIVLMIDLYNGYTQIKENDKQIFVAWTAIPFRYKMHGKPAVTAVEAENRNGVPSVLYTDSLNEHTNN